MGHERPICGDYAMSASPRKATESLRRTKWRFGPSTGLMLSGNSRFIRFARRRATGTTQELISRAPSLS